MSKTIHFFGQSVFGQLISLLDRGEISKQVAVTGSDKHCKGFYTWDHIVTMLFCSLSDCTSLREVVGAFLGLKGKTEHLGLQKLPRRSTLSDANKRRHPRVFELVYQDLLKRYRFVLPDSRLNKKVDKQVTLIDSTTISLFKSILRCVGRKPANGKYKGGVKVHTLLKSDQMVPQLIWFSDAATHDSLFWEKINFKKEELYVFDKAYVDYERYEQFTQGGICFVSRLKENAAFKTIEELDIDGCDNNILKDEWITLPIRKNGHIIRTTTARRIAYWDQEQSRLLIFITNLSQEFTADQVAALYKQRWQIETLFKQLKQNFPLKYFLGDNENAIIIQIWCVLIANLLLTVIQNNVKRSWAFSNIISFCRVHLFNYIHLISFLENPEKDWETQPIAEPLLLFSD